MTLRPTLVASLTAALPPLDQCPEAAPSLDDPAKRRTGSRFGVAPGYRVPNGGHSGLDCQRVDRIRRAAVDLAGEVGRRSLARTAGRELQVDINRSLDFGV
jgi:hypothetical protein